MSGCQSLVKVIHDFTQTVNVQQSVIIEEVGIIAPRGVHDTKGMLNAKNVSLGAANTADLDGQNIEFTEATVKYA